MSKSSAKVMTDMELTNSIHGIKQLFTSEVAGNGTPSAA